MKQLNNHNENNCLHHDIPLNSHNQEFKEDFNFHCFQQLLNLKTYRKQIQKKIEQLNDKRIKIFQKVVFYEKTTQQQFKDYIRGEAPQRKKRNRRNADQIQRQYNCPTCSKKYGSEGSMFQHIKLKHPNIYEPKKKGQRSEGSQSFDEQGSQ